MSMRTLCTAAAIAVSACSQQPTDNVATLSPRSVDGIVKTVVDISDDKQTATVTARVVDEAPDSVFWAFRALPDSAFTVNLVLLEHVADGVIIAQSSGPSWFYINFSPTAAQFTPLRRGATGVLKIPLVKQDGTPLMSGEYRVRVSVAIYGVTDVRRGVSSEFGAVSESEATFSLP